MKHSSQTETITEESKIINFKLNPPNKVQFANDVNDIQRGKNHKFSNICCIFHKRPENPDDFSSSSDEDCDLNKYEKYPNNTKNKKSSTNNECKKV